ncbi:hypothetical protein AAC387_Pa02g5076 [Persea americana]
MVALLETKVQDTSTNRTFKLLSQSLPLHVVVPGTGQGGGLWICWDPQAIKVDLLHNSSQHVTLTLTFQDDPSSMAILTVVYASPNWLQRRHLWEALSQWWIDYFSQPNRTPWLLIGDVNCILVRSEKRGGFDFIQSPAVRDFQNFTITCSLTDMGFIGQPFTWSNMRSGNSRILERLDRGFASENWFVLFPDWFLHHLPRIGSDHCPLLLAKTHTPEPRQRLFRYENMWHKHPLFENWALTQWPTLRGHLMDKLHGMSSSLSKWNQKTFGNILSELTRIQNRIQGIQTSPSYQHSHFLHQLERDLLTQHALKIHQVNEFWAQRARVTWLSQGDRNTRFFHTAAKILHRKNRILSIIDDQGRTLLNQSDISDHCHQYFYSLSTKSHIPTKTQGPSR